MNTRGASDSGYMHDKYSSNALMNLIDRVEGMVAGLNESGELNARSLSRDA